ncbi:MAG: flotillin family protein, partial [Kordia sp.]|nr:flotillin family protein [Kordia sp.]
RLVQHSETIQNVKDAILGSDDVKGNLLNKIKEFAVKYNISSQDIKNLTIANLLMNLQNKSNDDSEQTMFSNLMNFAEGLGLSDAKLG